MRLSASRTSLRPAFGALRAVTASSLRFHACGHLSLPGTVPLRLEPCPRHRRQLPISRTYRARRAPFLPASRCMSCLSSSRRCSLISTFVAVFPVFTLPPTGFLWFRGCSVLAGSPCRRCAGAVFVLSSWLGACTVLVLVHLTACPASASSGASHMASCTWLPRVASRVGRPDRLRFAIARNEAGEYRTANIVFHEALSMPEAVPGAA